MNRVRSLAVAAALVVASGCAAPANPAPTSTAQATATPGPTPATTAPSATPVLPFAGDVAYAGQSPAQRLDVYIPSVGAARHPLVVIIHGGGWTTGDKRGELPSAAVPGFLAQGFVVASVNYRLAGEAVFPAQLLDVKAAIRYLRANATRFQVDPERIGVIGESAGAHLAALLGTTAGVASFDDPALGNAGVSSAVQAVVDFYGPADLVTSDSQRLLNAGCPAQPDPNIALLLGASPSKAPALAFAASPVTSLHPGADLPPFFIAHGDADCVVPYQQSVELHDAIETVAPGRSKLAIVGGSGHYLAFDFNSQSKALAAFLATALRPE